MDQFDSFCNTVKDAISPLESGFRRAADDLCNDFFSHLKVSAAESSRPLRPDAGGDVEKKRKWCSSSKEKRNSMKLAVPFKSFLGTIFRNSARKDSPDKVALVKDATDAKEEVASCANCLHFAVAWSLFVNNFIHALPSPFKTGSRASSKPCAQDERPQHAAGNARAGLCANLNQRTSGSSVMGEFENHAFALKEGEVLSLELFFGFMVDTFVQCLCKFDQMVQEGSRKNCTRSNSSSSPLGEPDHLGAIAGILNGRKADVNGLLTHLVFARLGGIPSSMVGATSSVKDDGENRVSPDNREEPEVSFAPKLANGLLNIPLSNVERLRSTLSTVSLTELIELIPHLGRPSKDYPDKKKLFSVQDFFRYTESEGRRFFEELDRDGDGQVNLEDLEIVMRKRRLPRRYAREFFRRTRSHIFSKSFGWKQFLSLMEQKEPTILRAYTTLCLSKSGTLQKSQILTSLESAGLPANEDNAVAMMRFLNADTEGPISYGHFRNFMLLLPSERLEDDPRSIWFEAATVVAVPPPVEIPAESVLKSALAGGLACALSTSLMHPVDTMKTRVQASTLSFPDLVSKLPQIGLQGLYRGSIPAILGQFSSHGLRTGIFEATKLVLINVAPTIPEIQVQSLASFCSTVLGTAVRIPCEVLKQRLQAGIFDNVGEAIVGTFQQDGVKGFFRGTGATLCREVPFYVAGMGLYAEAKKAAQRLLQRDLEPWETVMVGALSGGLAAIVTTPFDVMKTRMMTAPPGMPVSMTIVAISILRQEGPLGLFKGAVPRFFWIAPLGAMNFAGYELARKAMDRSEHPTSEQLSTKRLANAG